MGGKRDKRKKNPEAKAKKAAKQEQKASKVGCFVEFGGIDGWDGVGWDGMGCAWWWYDGLGVCGGGGVLGGQIGSVG